MASDVQDTPDTIAVTTAPAPEAFDLLSTDIPSFAALQLGRAAVYQTPTSLQSFEQVVANLPPTGEEGRRRGLGLWILGRHQEAAEALVPYPDDDVATYTRARALLSLNRFSEAAPLFERLSKSYPEEPRPRGGWLEALFEQAISEGDEEAAVAALEAALSDAPPSFAESAEGRYIRGRACEARRDWETAIDEYLAARELDSSLTPAIFRGACLAERGGLDKLAVEMYEQLVHSRPIDRRVLLNLGVLYEDLGRDQDAAACYDIVARFMPTDQRARLYLEDARQAIDMYYDEDLERKEDRLNQILRIPISDFELSVRARNCLNKMNITTLGDLVQRTEQELLSYKNFGETSLNEIKEILHSKGLRLGMPRDEAVASVESAARRSQASSDPGDVMNKPITELQLSIRARRTVEALGCLTVGDITKHSASELLGMPNFGNTSLQELKGKLSELSLGLRDD
jgi:DNA-directed RNA polymerase subunit alpha